MSELPDTAKPEWSTVTRLRLTFPVEERDNVLDWSRERDFEIVRSGPLLTGAGRSDAKKQYWVLEKEHPAP